MIALQDGKPLTIMNIEVTAGILTPALSSGRCISFINEDADPRHVQRTSLVIKANLVDRLRTY